MFRSISFKSLKRKFIFCRRCSFISIPNLHTTNSFALSHTHKHTKRRALNFDRKFDYKQLTSGNYTERAAANKSFIWDGKDCLTSFRIFFRTKKMKKLFIEKGSKQFIHSRRLLPLISYHIYESPLAFTSHK